MPNKLHHYIPQFILRNFASRQNKAQFYIRSYERDKKSYESNVDNIAGQRGLYTLQEKTTLTNTDMLEDFFTKLEDTTAPIISSIIEHEEINLTDVEKRKLDDFMAFLYIRTPGFQENQRRMDILQRKAVMRSMASNKERFRAHMAKSGIKIKDDQELEKLRQGILRIDEHATLELKGGESHYIKEALEFAKDFAPCFYMKKLSLIRASGEEVFVVPDNPIIPLPQDELYFKGLMHSTILIPLTPKLCLMYDNEKPYDGIVTMSDEKVKKINTCAMFYAEKYVFANIESKQIQELFNSTPHEVISAHQLDAPDSSLLISSKQAPPFLASEIL